jgi:hypothetical protein
LETSTPAADWPPLAIPAGARSLARAMTERPTPPHLGGPPSQTAWRAQSFTRLSLGTALGPQGGA